MTTTELESANSSKQNNYWEWGAYALAVLATLYQYAPVYHAGFPLEPESAVFLRYFQQFGWFEAVTATNYFAIHPALNMLVKAMSAVYAGNASLLAPLVTLFHLGNLFLLWRLARQLGGVWVGLVALFFFASFNAYYHLLANPCAGLSLFVVYGLIKIFYLVMDRLGSETQALHRALGEAAAIVIAFLLPLLFMVSGIFLYVFLLLAVGRRFARHKQLRILSLKVLAAHFLSLGLQVFFLDARFIHGSIVEKATGYSPDSFHLVASFLENPATFLFSVAHNAFTGIEFGLLYQNFLFAGGPWRWPYLAGMAALACYVCGSFLLSAERRRIHLALWGLIFVNMFSVSLMRNPFNTEAGRIFDAFYVASMPRYYYLPSAALAICVAFVFVELAQRAKAWPLRVLIIAVVLGLLAGNLRFSRWKTEYLAEHMASGIWAYVPPGLLRPPPSDPRDLSFERGKAPQ